MERAVKFSDLKFCGLIKLDLNLSSVIFCPYNTGYIFKLLEILFPHLLNRDNKSTTFTRLLKVE